MKTACAQYSSAIAAAPAMTSSANVCPSGFDRGRVLVLRRTGRAASDLTGVVIGGLLYVTARPARSWSALLIATAAFAPSAAATMTNWTSRRRRPRRRAQGRASGPDDRSCTRPCFVSAHPSSFGRSHCGRWRVREKIASQGTRSPRASARNRTRPRSCSTAAIRPSWTSMSCAARLCCDALAAAARVRWCRAATWSLHVFRASASAGARCAVADDGDRLLALFPSVAVRDSDAR